MLITNTTAGACGIQATLFQKSKVQIFMHHPFFATLAGYLDTVARPAEWFLLQGAPLTACVDGRRIYYYPEFVESLTEPQRIGLLIHEICHCAFQHLWRRGNRDPKLWNYAVDYAANAIIRNATVRVKDGNRTIERAAFELPPGALYDARFEGMAAEEIYAILRDECETQGRDEPRAGQGQGVLDGHIETPLKGEGEGDDDGDGKGVGQGEGGKSDKDGDGKGRGQGDGQGQGQSGEGEGEGSGGGADGDGQSKGGHTDLKSEDFQEKLVEEWKQRLNEAVYVATAKGNMPGNLTREIDGIIDPVMPWQRVVDHYATEIQRNDYDMRYADRRFIEQGIRLPDLSSEECAADVYFDVSGSIGRGEQMAMLGEAQGLLQCRGIRNLRIMACDTRVTMDVNVGPHDELPTRLPGGGGTSLIPPFERRLEEPGEIRSSLIIYFTDLCAGEDIPTDDPGVPVIWLWLKPRHYREDWISKPSFGMVVEYQPLTDDPYGQAA